MTRRTVNIAHSKPVNQTPKEQCKILEISDISEDRILIKSPPTNTSQTESSVTLSQSGSRNDEISVCNCGNSIESDRKEENSLSLDVSRI